MIGALASDEHGRRMQRMARFTTDAPELQKRKITFLSEEGPTAKQRKQNAIASKSSQPVVYEEGPIKGVCDELEKDYLRLTSAPDPAKVRPLHVLKQSFKLIKKTWVESHDYAQALSQLKSIRQDAAVQRIHGPFMVDVYETHARIAVEKGNLVTLKTPIIQA